MITPQKPIFLILIAVLSFLVLFTIELEAQDKSHTVRTGETLFAISRMYDVSVEDIRKWNNLRDNQLSIGQVLIIKQEEESVEKSSFKSHRVQPGETLFSISRTYDVSVQDIMLWNNMSNTSLSVGQVLMIQGQSSDSDLVDTIESTTEIDEANETQRVDTVAGRFVREAGDSHFYIVEPGDTMFRIARRHNMTVSELQDLNNKTNTSLEIGDRLLVRAFRVPPSIANEPLRTTPQGAFLAHTLEDDESIRDLLGHFRMDIPEFLALNPDKDINDVRSGDRVVLLAPSNVINPNPYRIRTQRAGIEEISLSFYSDEDTGRTLTSGELYNPNQLSAAHPSLPLGSVVYVENPINGIGLYLLVNDRNIDQSLRISHAAASYLEIYLESAISSLIIYRN